MSAVMTERLVAVAQAARQAGHGDKGRIYASACAELGCSHATLMRQLKKVAVSAPRKRRSDAGTTALSRDEALTISSALMASARKNDKRLFTVEDAVSTLRDNGMVRAEVIDEATGEVRPLSVSSITRALRLYGMHPDQLLAPAPVTSLATRHPNHVWQIDASLCVLYYLKPGADTRANGLRVMEHDQFYKNKPANVARIAANRVWSYEITDHASGWIYTEYVMGAESGENLCSVLINAMQDRGGHDLLHGVPRILMLDPGSANTAAMTRNLCRSLGIWLMPHKPGNARATGQVEKARDIIERKFEAGLRFQPVADLDELNALARKWRAHFNATAIHSRHGMTRSQAWLRIRQEQLIKAPTIAVCRELAVAEPESRKVNSKLRVSFGGREYDVSTVPDVMVGEKLMVTRNPWRSDAAQVVLVGEDGREVFHIVDVIEKDDYGYSTGAATIGEDYKRHADTPAQLNRRAAERLAAGASTQAELEAATKARAVPFGGRLDPYKHLDDTDDLPAFLPRRGTAHGLVAPQIELPPLSHVEAARLLKARVEEAGGEWTSERFLWLRQRWPVGVPQDQVEALTAELMASLTNKKPARHLRRAGGEPC